jgi:hypothetical protein
MTMKLTTVQRRDALIRDLRLHHMGREILRFDSDNATGVKVLRADALAIATLDIRRRLREHIAELGGLASAW